MKSSIICKSTLLTALLLPGLLAAKTRYSIDLNISGGGSYSSHYYSSSSHRYSTPQCNSTQRPSSHHRRPTIHHHGHHQHGHMHYSPRSTYRIYSYPQYRGYSRGHHHHYHHHHHHGHYMRQSYTCPPQRPILYFRW